MYLLELFPEIKLIYPIIIEQNFPKYLLLMLTHEDRQMARHLLISVQLNRKGLTGISASFEKMKQIFPVLKFRNISSDDSFYRNKMRISIYPAGILKRRHSKKSGAIHSKESPTYHPNKLSH